MRAWERKLWQNASKFAAQGKHRKPPEEKYDWREAFRKFDQELQADRGEGLPPAVVVYNGGKPAANDVPWDKPVDTMSRMDIFEVFGAMVYDADNGWTGHQEYAAEHEQAHAAYAQWQYAQWLRSSPASDPR